MADLFEYSPLSPGQIRILVLRADEETAPIICSLRHAFFEDIWDYEAVSYTWGTESHNRPITINGKRFYVSPTLKQALKQFRKRIPKMTARNFSWTGERRTGGQDNAAGLRCLWIDAICINQTDLEERNQQIQFMARIYRNSSRLLVWLGVSASNSDNAMKFLEELGDQDVQDQSRLLKWIESQTKLKKFPTLVDSIASLISRPWFTRTWILQEFVLGASTKTLFHCGNRSVYGDDFRALLPLKIRDLEALYLRRRFEPLSRKIELSVFVRQYVVAERNYLRLFAARLSVDLHLMIGRTRSLEYWLACNRDTEGIDPRDKIYSVLGILEHFLEKMCSHCSAGYDSTALILNYSAKVEDVYSSVVKAISMATGKLDILAHCSQNSALVSRTWTPDWTVESQTSYTDGRAGHPAVNPTIFHACQDEKCIATFSEDLTTMTVAGIVWGVVAFHKTVHTGPLVNSLHGTLKETMKRPCQRIWRFLAQLHSYPSKQLAQLAFLRALLTVFQNCRAHSHTSSTSSQTLSDHLPQELLSQDLGNWRNEPSS